MRYIKISGGTAFCGHEFEKYLYTNMTDKELNEYSAFMASENAICYENIRTDYGIYYDNYRTHQDYETAFNEALEIYYAKAYADWEEITKEEYEENK